jgi:epoxyqueuosine reductase
MGHVEGRGFVDSAPVLERSWAQRSGLGWIGKNGNLINKKMGSFFFIATLITDLELEPDVPHVTDHCGTCSRCVDACPTDAILIDKTVDASKCISYFTIELKSKDLPEDLKSKSENWIFGCDICQDVCPWNRFSKPHQHQELEPFKEIMQFNIEDWLDINEESFKKIFKHSPLKRSGFEGIKRNLRLYQG